MKLHKYDFAKFIQCLIRMHPIYVSNVTVSLKEHAV